MTLGHPSRWQPLGVDMAAALTPEPVAVVCAGQLEPIMVVT